MKTGLLIVDIQNDYFPGGRMELVGSVDASKNAGDLLSAFREKGLPVFHLQHISSRPGAAFFLPNTPGAEIQGNVAPFKERSLSGRIFQTAFRGTNLLERLKESEVTRLVVAGMMTHMCIDTTVRAAFDLGFQCELAHDACATKALSFGSETIPARQVHLSFVSALQGVFASVSSTREIIAKLFEQVKAGEHMIMACFICAN